MMTGWTMSLDGWLWMAVWVAVLVAAVWLLTRSPGRTTQDDPVSLLRSRLARGEITPEEFERTRALLESSPRGGAR
jgi:putative membrane protein